MDIVKQFIIGSNGLIAIMFYLIYFNIPNNIKTITNEKYALLPPLYFGLMNIFMIGIKKYYKLDDITTILLAGFMSSFFVYMIAYFNNIYKIEKKEWIVYYATLVVLHFITFSVINEMNNLLLD